MRRCWILCILGLLTLQSAVAQQTQFAFRISFTDKQGAAPLSNPLSFLSQRAIDRRTTQGIAVDETDRPVSPDYIDSVLVNTSGVLHLRSKWLNYCVVLLTDSSQILNLTGKPFISNIEYIAYYGSGLHNKPSGNSQNPKFDVEQKSVVFKKTGTQAYYGATFDQTRILNGDYLHDLNYKGQGMLIAVLDEGFRYTDTGPAFDSLRQSGRLVDQYDFVQANTNVYVATNHGTNSLSTMAGNIPGVYVGSAPYASYALYITEDGINNEQRIEMDNLLAATERADSLGADVVTVSLGYNEFFLPTNTSLTYADIDGKSTIAAQAANIATSKGVLFVASAGNEGNGSSWNYILTPGDADSAITVGSVSLNKVPASYSGYGPNSSQHIKPNVCVVGHPAWLMSASATPASINGTSFATPQLAGWAACLMQGSSGYTPYSIRTAIEKSAHVYNTPGVQLGYGVPDFRKAFDFLHVDSPMLPQTDWITVGPNPVVSRVSMRVFQSTTGTLNVVLVDALGKKVADQTYTVYQGTQVLQFDVPEVSNGIYYLKAKTETSEAAVKLFKY